MGNSSAAKAEAHEMSDQVLLLLEGELTDEMGEAKATLKKGSEVIISAGMKHRFALPPAHRAQTNG